MTTTERIEKLLDSYLEHLDNESLRRFQRYLCLNQREGSQLIPKCRLQDKTREETVDILVEVYGEDDAVVTTVDIFFRMNLNDLAAKLTQAMMDRKEQQSHVPVSSTERENQRDVDSTGTEDLSCSLGFHVFTDPVALQCGHSFCKSCVHDHWSGKTSRRCPLCQRVMPNTEPPINYVVRSLVENSRERSRDEPSGGQRHDSESNQTPSKNIKEKKVAFEKVKQLSDSSIGQIKSQSRDTEKTIKDKFEELRLFLKKEEETRLAALKEEETQRICTMQLITETFKEEMERTQKVLQDPQQLPQAQINVSEHLEKLQFRVWKKMLSNIKFNPYITSELQPMYEEWESPVREYICGEDDEEDHAAFFGEATRSRFNTEEMAFKSSLPYDEDDKPQVMFSSIH